MKGATRFPTVVTSGLLDCCVAAGGSNRYLPNGLYLHIQSMDALALALGFSIAENSVVSCIDCLLGSDSQGVSVPFLGVDFCVVANVGGWQGFVPLIWIVELVVWIVGFSHVHLHLDLHGHLVLPCHYHLVDLSPCNLRGGPHQ